MNKIELNVNKELEAIIPKLSHEEFETLKGSIQREGLLKPIDVMADEETIVDGHHRYRACQILGVELTESDIVILKNIKSIEDALKYSFEVNFARRHLNTYQKAEWAMSCATAQNISGSTGAEMSEKLGISESFISKVSVIMKKASEETKVKLRLGELGVRPVYDALNLAEDVKNKLEYTTPETKQVIEEKYMEQLTNPETMSRVVEENITHDIDEAKNMLGNAYLKRFYFPENTFKTMKEAEEFAEKFDGKVICKRTTVEWELNLDRVKVRQAKKEGKIGDRINAHF